MSTEMNINNTFPPSPPNNILSIINPSKLDNIIPEPGPGHENTSELNEEQFIPGMFLYINSENTRYILQNAWAAITQLELWNYMKLDTDSYMFNNNPLVNKIYQKIEDLGYYGHSGSSFGWTMRQMQYIAKYGETEFMKIYQD
jgi:hypothetical protein